jgi:hypothetical protein
MARKILAVVVFIAVMTVLAQFLWWGVGYFGVWFPLPFLPLIFWLAVREDRKAGIQHHPIIRLKRLFGFRGGR